MSLVLSTALSAMSLVFFGVPAVLGAPSPGWVLCATVLLLISVSGVIAMLIPYAAEIYPVFLRGTGSVVVAASSKFGGFLGARLAVLGFFENFAMSALALALPMAVAALMLTRSGIETRGFKLEEIQDVFAGAR